MDSALDLIFAKEEETLEEFQENISTLSSREWVANDDGISIVHGATANHQLNDSVAKIALNGRKDTPDDINLDIDNKEEEEIPCEELDIGISTGSQMLLAQNKGSIMPKVDNFIDIEENDDSSEDHVSSLSSLSDLEEEKEDNCHYDADLSPSSGESNIKEGSLLLQEDICTPTQNSEEIVDMDMTANLSNDEGKFNVVVLNHVNENDQLPGEADEETEGLSSMKTRITNIAIKTKMAAPPNVRNLNSEPGTDEAEITVPCSSNEVETFKLDDDFDYDNVELTPKFSIEDSMKSSTG